MPITWDDLDESTKFGVLRLVATQAVLSAERTMRRSNLTLASASKRR